MIVVETLEALGIAYRKAKVDLYYSSDPSLASIANYEQDLSENLSDLQRRINGDDETWIESSDFLGTWSLAPKSVDVSGIQAFDHDQGGRLRFSSPSKEWEFLRASTSSPEEASAPKAEFRLMAKCSMDFHVLSSLWILEVGHLFDAKLDSCAYGNRLRTPAEGAPINKLSLGSFTQYLQPFRNWHQRGIDAMRAGLDDEKEIVAITADVSSFYHELNASFLADFEFITNIVGIDLTPQQEKIHRLFVGSLSEWANVTPLRKGLPVGLPASAIVANIALVELDRVIKRDLTPLYYGRYVDDIFIVMENGANFRTAEDLWNWLFDRTGGYLNWAKDAKGGIAFKTDYLERHECDIRFANEKNKVFMVAGDTGRTFLNALSQQIQQRTYDWGAMPHLPQASGDVGVSLISAMQGNGAVADSLQETNSINVRRAEFALRLRDLEAYERDLEPNTWQEHRRAFFLAFTQYVLALPQFFELEIYLSRVIGMATACKDFEDLEEILNALEKICNIVENDCDVGIKACPSSSSPSPENIISRWQSDIANKVFTSITASFPTRLSEAQERGWTKHISQHPFLLRSETYYPLATDVMTIDEIMDRYVRLFSFDLAHVPFRFLGLPEEMVSQRGLPFKKQVLMSKNIAGLLPVEVRDGVEAISDRTNINVAAHGFYFSTRPYNPAELSLLPGVGHGKDGAKFRSSVALALRGYQLTTEMPEVDQNNVLQVYRRSESPSYRVAVSSWKTQIESWEAAVRRMPDKDHDRYRRLNQMVDGVIAQPEGCNYLILPELALPARWFLRVAGKLAKRGISLISGVEYMHKAPSMVQNQVWASLVHDGLGFPSFMIYRQDKQRPAPNEERELFDIAGLVLVPEFPVWNSPPIIQHGDFRFAMLVCSELTNIGNRSALPGEIDALFIPEWNQDTETFNALVESAALDIHAYIIQCNDRQFGDSRIRAPYKNAWERDVVRMKGGIADYFVIGEIDITSLRKFQDNHRSPKTPFKPTPDGFKMNSARRLL